MRTWLRWCWIGAFTLAAGPGLAIEVRDIPRPERWAIDLTGRVPADALAKFEVTADQVEREKGGQMVLVVVGSLDGKPSRPFAQELFNSWQIGRKEANDGVLLFLALDDHSLELLLGDGLDDLVRQQASEVVVQDVIVPRLKRGDLSGAVVEGALQSAERIYRLPPLVAAGVSKVASVPPSARGWVGPINSSGEEWIVPLAVLCFLGGIVALLVFFRRAPRCCQQPMVELTAPTRDEHLSAGQRTEESLGSVVYSVWSCTTCRRIDPEPRIASFRGFGVCSACGFRTAFTIRRVLEAATTVSQGSAEVVETCRFCNFRNVSQRSIPRIRPVRRTERHRAYSSSPKSSGRSFGGGRTSGGGASGKW